MLTLLLATILSFSGELTKVNPNCACVKEISDPFEQPAEYNYGEHKGRCIDSCRFRPVQILHQSKDSVSVANLLHHGVFYQTQINLKDVVSVEAGFEMFTPGVNHVVLKFNLKNPLTLTEQVKGPRVAQMQTQSLVVSAEGVPGRGFDYSLFEGFQGDYLIVTRVVTFEEFKRWTQKLNNPVSLYSLNRSPEQSQKAFSAALMTSFENGLTEKYQLLTNNCSSKAYSFLGHKDIHNLTAFQKMALVLPIDGPLSTKQFLIKEKLISHTNASEPVASPELN